MEKTKIIEFIKAKLATAKASLKAREQMERIWRGGTDASWRAVGCPDSKAGRIKTADIHGRIAVKCRREVKMFKAVLEALN